jgi:hypothetical protein
MSLLERTRSLEVRVKRQREQQVREHLAKIVRDRTRNLEKHLNRLAVAGARAAALEEAGHERSHWPAPPLGAFEAYDLQGDALSIESPRQDEWQKFVLTLDKFVDKIDKLVAQDVKRTKKSFLEGVTSEELRGYLADPSSQSQVQGLLNALETLQQKNWETLPGPELLRILASAGTFRDDVVRLREMGASEDLLRFLTLAGKGEAPLTSLTEPLREELEKRQLLSRLRLTMK